MEFTNIRLYKRGKKKLSDLIAVQFSYFISEKTDTKNTGFPFLTAADMQ